MLAAFFMEYTVYIIYSGSKDQYYVGHSADVEDRLFRHNNSGSKSTRGAKDWIIVYREEFESRSEAMRREKEIKSKKSRKYIEGLIENEKLNVAERIECCLSKKKKLFNFPDTSDCCQSFPHIQ